ncbi:hypothetical protein [Dyadobacter sp. CY356]|uniref:YybH family protein n=1 Tax=Dyadobacter sp. CY356 TaxID=2906442 RepID=UPI001F2C71C5|nr:hypothetical protein [Dyadobacter sp. CY356]MCF0055282.1 hypothetical protein [Dyadobacter sp. CY356]
MSSQEEIEKLVRQQERAVQLKDIDGAMAQYREDVVSFDVVNTLDKVGVLACRERLASWLSQFPAEFSYSVEQPTIVASEYIAFCYSFNHVKGVLAGGDEIDMRWRSLFVFKKCMING